jgi:hypothetical protein
LLADEHQELNRDEACVYGILADLVCGWVGVSSRRHMLNAVEATRRALRGGLKVATAATLLELIMLESTSKLKALTGFHVEPWVEGEEGAQE